MALEALVCTAAGHRSEPSARSDASVLVLHCRRCGRASIRTSDTFDAESRLDRMTRPWRPKS